MSNFHFLKKDLEWKIVNLQCWGPHSPHNPHNPTMAPYHRSRKQLYTLAPWHRARSALIPIATFVPLLPLSSILVQERKCPFTGSPEMSDKLRYEWRLYLHTFTTPFAFWHTLFSLFSYRSREKTIHPPLYPLSGKSRNEWQIEIWVTNHFKILSTYYTWSLSWTTYYYLNIHNNPFGEKNNSSFSIALDDPSSILTKLLCIFAHTIIPISFLTLIS